MGRRHSHYKKRIEVKKYRINEQIKSPYVKAIDPDQGPIGILKTEEALKKAKDKGLDLIEVSPKENPPVAKIMLYSKFRYTLEKKRQKSKKVELKGLRLSLNMAHNDIETKFKHGKKFLSQGHQLQLEMFLKGRQLAHTSRAFEQINDFIKKLAEEAVTIQQPNKKGARLTAILQPK